MLNNHNHFSVQAMRATAVLRMNTSGGEMEIEKTGEELAQRIRDVGFLSGALGTLSHCDALVFTEITARSRNTVELDFRVVLSDEQAPRLCSRSEEHTSELQ